MPSRNLVPTLKLLAIRTIAMPLTVNTKFHVDNTVNITASVKAWKKICVEWKKTNKNKKDNFFKATAMSYGTQDGIGLGGLGASMEAIINAWIRLSAYYSTSLKESYEINNFFGYRTIFSLDFLHESVLLRNGSEIRYFARFIPNTARPQPVTPVVYKEFIRLLSLTGNIETLSNLYISFKSDPQAHKIRDRDFDFEDNFKFIKLSKLIVHGQGANDLLLSSIGYWCKRLKYLDVRGSNVTEVGILLLLLHRPERDIKLFSKSTLYARIPELLNSLTLTLQYLDISTVKEEGRLMFQDRVIRICCPQLRGTLGRVFYNPGGELHLRTKFDHTHSLTQLQKTVLMTIKKTLVTTMEVIAIEIKRSFHFTESVNAIEIRRNQLEEESAILFLHENLVVLELQIEQLTVISILCHSICTTNFLAVDKLVEIAPQLKEIRASLRGVVTKENHFPDLEKLVSPFMDTKETLISIFKYSKKLIYVEVQEIFHSPTGITLNDDDMKEMLYDIEDEIPVNGRHENLEIFRLRFKNQITIYPGLKDLVKLCLALRIIGDLKYWKGIPFTTVKHLAQELTLHNFDLLLEYKGLLYNTNTPVKEFYR